MAANTSTDNPWESAALDRQFRQEQERLNGGEAETTTRVSASAATSSFSSPCGKGRILLVLHGFDMILGLFVLVYAIISEQQRSKKKKSIDLEESLSWIVGGMLVLRALGGFSATLCGLRMSGSLSLILGVVDFVASMTALGMTIRGTLRNYLAHHDRLLHLLSKHPHAIWSFILGCAVLEWIRWALINRIALEISGGGGLQDTPMNSSSPENSFYQNRRPWWWGRNQHHNNSLSESLLHNGDPHWTSVSQNYHISDGVDNSSSGWWPWSRNHRDDASVDYASLNEDWASRSEEDPLWWTKEDDERQQRQEQQSTAHTNDV